MDTGDDFGTRKRPRSNEADPGAGNGKGKDEALGPEDEKGKDEGMDGDSEYRLGDKDVKAWMDDLLGDQEEGKIKTSKPAPAELSLAQLTLIENNKARAQAKQFATAERKKAEEEARKAEAQAKKEWAKKTEEEMVEKEDQEYRERRVSLQNIHRALSMLGMKLEKQVVNGLTKYI
jgi:hypothetical protein